MTHVASPRWPLVAALASPLLVLARLLAVRRAPIADPGRAARSSRRRPSSPTWSRRSAARTSASRASSRRAASSRRSTRRPRDVAALSEADLVVMNGLGLDDWLEPVIASAAPDVPVVRLGEDLPGVDVRRRARTARRVNPHLWLDVTNAARVRAAHRRALAAARSGARRGVPGGRRGLRARLGELDAGSASRSRRSRPTNRKLVSLPRGVPVLRRGVRPRDRRLGRRRARPGPVGRRGRRARRRDQALRREGRLHGGQFNPQLAEGDRRRGRRRRSRATSTTTRWATRRSTRTRA